jgi:hypothetical protein
MKTRRVFGTAIFFMTVSCSLLLAQHGEQRGGEQRGGEQRGGEAHVGGGFVPSRGPAPHSQPAAHPEPHPAGNPHPTGGAPNGHAFADGKGHPEAPHVHDNGQWVGHDSGRNDEHYHLDHPWAHGRFPGAIGASHVWRLSGGGPSRFGFGGFFFSVAPYDVGFCNGWDWNSDDITIYDDPDHVGWYLAYNVRLGVYVHVQYL